MASNDLNNTLVPRSGARGQKQPSAQCPDSSGADRRHQECSASQGAGSAAMLRSRSGEGRARRGETIDPGEVRRALPVLDDSVDDADLAVVSTDPAVQVLVVRQAGLRLDPSGQNDIMVNILRSELQAAFGLMEHRERWWIEGWHNAESTVGMEMDRIRVGELNAAQEMNSQMTSLVDTLRATQNRAEQSSLAVLDQQRIANDPESCATRLTSHGRAMIKQFGAEALDHRHRAV